MNRRAFALTLLGGALLAGSWSAVPGYARSHPKKVLVLTYATGFKHSSRQLAAETVKKLGAQTGEWEVVDVIDDQEKLDAAITAENLKKVDLVFFASTTGDLHIPPAGHQAFYDWIRAGGAYAGVHSASDTYHGDADYLNLVGGEFQTHGAQREVEVFNQDPKHPACKKLPASFKIFDEIYEFKNWERGKVHMLLTMHKHPQRDEQGDFPVAWTNRVGKGRMFYTSLGHREDVYGNPLYLEHLTGGIKWALGLEKGSDEKGNPIL